MSKWQPTPFEVITAGGLAVVAGASTSPAAILPTLGLCAVGVYAARRSERLGRLAGDTPARFLLVDDGDDTESTKLAVPAKELKRQKEAAAPEGTGRFRLKALDGFMASISSEARPDVRTSALEEVNGEKDKPEAAQATETAQKADKKAKPESDADWVAQASAGVPDGLDQGKVASLRQVAEALNKQVDDFPHVLVVGDSGAGKTTLVQLIVGTRPGKVVILDPKRPKGWEGAKWGGLPYVSRDKQTSSYGPMVKALALVVEEMNRRYRMQDEATEPFEMLTVVLDEGKNSVEESPELAALYRKIVSIGREVGIRLVLISTTDRAGKLGFDGEADSMESFAWVQLGEFALKVRGDLRERGKGQPKQKVYWAVASFAGGWIPFENEKAFSLLPSLNLRRQKAWAKVEYNCQTDAQPVRKAQNEWPEERAVAVRTADQDEPKGTRELQAIMLDDERERPVVNGYVYTDADIALLTRLTGAGRSVKDKPSRSADEVENTSAVRMTALQSTSDAEIRTSGVQTNPVVLAENTLKTVPAVDQSKLGKALRLFATNGQKVTPAITAGWGTAGGDKFTQRAEWLRAAHTVLLARQARAK